MASKSPTMPDSEGSVTITQKAFLKVHGVKYFPREFEALGAEDVFNELTIVFPELPSYRDVLIDRWSNDLAKNGTQTEKEYSWKEAFDYSMINNDEYDDE